MRTCSNCGSTVREGARFCTACGTRLNDSGPSGQINSWALNDTEATTVAPAVTAAETAAPDEPDNPPDTTESSEAADSSGFSWSWGAGAEAQPAVEDDDGTLDVVASDDPGESESPDQVDATESEILADQPEVSDEPDAVPAGDEAGIVPDESTAEALDSSDESTDDTLAAWAGEWTSDEEPADSGQVDDEDDGLRSAVGPARGTEPDDEGDDEDPAERAERLLAELQKVLPRLARRTPPVPVGPGSPLPSGLLDDLDDDDGDSFDDVRQTIESVRNNPRDIDTMLKLAGNSERLKSLLDDRDRQAHRFETLRNRLRDQLRAQDTSGEDQGDFL